MGTAAFALVVTVALVAAYWLGWGGGARTDNDPTASNIAANAAPAPQELPTADAPAAPGDTDVKANVGDQAYASPPAAPVASDTQAGAAIKTAPPSNDAAAPPVGSADRSQTTRKPTKRKRGEHASKTSRNKRRGDKAGGRRRGDEGAKVAKKPAALTLNSIPWAKVYIDGRDVGITPLLDVAVSPGQHKLRFFDPDKKRTKKQTVNLKPGEKRRIQVRF